MLNSQSSQSSLDMKITMLFPFTLPFLSLEFRKRTRIGICKWIISKEIGISKYNSGNFLVYCSSVLPASGMQYAFECWEDQE